MSESSCIGHPFYQATLFIQRDYSLVYTKQKAMTVIVNQNDLEELKTFKFFYTCDLFSLLIKLKQIKLHTGLSYNHGKNGWHTLSDLGEKETPSPNAIAILIWVMLSQTLPDSSTLIWWGWGRIMVKERTSLLSIKQCHAPFSTSVVSMGIDLINCIRCANHLNFFHDCRSLVTNKHALTVCPTRMT